MSLVLWERKFPSPVLILRGTENVHPPEVLQRQFAASIQLWELFRSAVLGGLGWVGPGRAGEGAVEGGREWVR